MSRLVGKCMTTAAALIFMFAGCDKTLHKFNVTVKGVSYTAD